MSWAGLAFANHPPTPGVVTNSPWSRFGMKRWIVWRRRCATRELFWMLRGLGKMTENIQPPPRRALVLFTGRTEIKWLRILKPGFRHCMGVLQDQEGWVVCNPLSHQTEIFFFRGGTLKEVSAAYRTMGFTVVESIIQKPPLRLAPLRPYTCVEAVKRLLGIHHSMILTPWQLYRFLMRGKKN
jgi:hypothetical protein